MACDHTRRVYPPQVQNDWTGEWEDSEPYVVSTCEDISIGAYRCTRCGEVGYYTGKWREYHEKGTPCFGSENVPRKLR